MLDEMSARVRCGHGIAVAPATVGPSPSTSADADASSADCNILHRAGVMPRGKRGPTKPPRRKPESAASRSEEAVVVKCVSAADSSVDDVGKWLRRKGMSMPSWTVVPVMKAHHTPEMAKVRLSTSPVDRQKSRRAALGGFASASAPGGGLGMCEAGGVDTSDRGLVGGVSEADEEDTRKVVLRRGRVRGLCMIETRHWRGKDRVSHGLR